MKHFLSQNEKKKDLKFYKTENWQLHTCRSAIALSIMQSKGNWRIPQEGTHHECANCHGKRCSRARAIIVTGLSIFVKMSKSVKSQKVTKKKKKRRTCHLTKNSDLKCIKIAWECFENQSNSIFWMHVLKYLFLSPLKVRNETIHKLLINTQMIIHGFFSPGNRSLFTPWWRTHHLNASRGGDK